MVGHSKAAHISVDVRIMFEVNIEGSKQRHYRTTRALAITGIHAVGEEMEINDKVITVITGGLSRAISH